MATGDETWDLSDNDQAALTTVLKSHDRLLAALKDLVERGERELADPQDCHELQGAKEAIEAAEGRP